MKLRTIIIGGAIVSIILGFTLGKTVIANSPQPGSNQDPVVSKSYVDAVLQDRVNELEKTVAELSVQAQALQATINELQDKLNLGGGKTTTPTKPSTPSTPSTEPSTPEKPAASVVGKTCYIKATNNYVNLRSEASTDSAVIKKVLKDEAMHIFEEKDKWYHVELDDRTIGWVASWVVDVK